MPVRFLDSRKFNVASVNANANADWHGNNAAFTCPVCSKVFIVTSFNNEGVVGRHCPGCGKSTAYVNGPPGGRNEAKIQWGG